MSGLQKRLRRKLLLDAARQQRKATAGGGKLRRDLNSWIRTTKWDLLSAFQEADRLRDSARDIDGSDSEMTLR